MASNISYRHQTKTAQNENNHTVDQSLPPLLQMAVRGFAMGMGNASWVRTAGTVSATLAGEGQAAVLPWRPPAMTTRTMKEVRNACWMQKLFLSPLASYASHLSRLEKRLHWWDAEILVWTVVISLLKMPVQNEYLVQWTAIKSNRLISFFLSFFFFAENLTIGTSN